MEFEWGPSFIFNFTGEINPVALKNFSSFGLHYIQEIFSFIFPGGNPIVKDWFLMRWWQVLFFSFAHPFLVINLRLYRLEGHQKPIIFIEYIGLFFSGVHMIAYLFILWEIFSYFYKESFFACHTSQNLQSNNLRMASVLWLFHVSRYFLDFIQSMKYILTRPLEDLRSVRYINETRISISHFISWWITLLYYPGGEVIYPVAVVCMFHLGTILCECSEGRFLRLKILIWIALVVSNFTRLIVNLVVGCGFPSTIFLLSPPYDINNNVHVLMFNFFSWFPLGFLIHFFVYGRGTLASWSTLFFFIICAHWPFKISLSSTKNRKRLKAHGLISRYNENNYSASSKQSSLRFTNQEHSSNRDHGNLGGISHREKEKLTQRKESSKKIYMLRKSEEYSSNVSSNNNSDNENLERYERSPPSISSISTSTSSTFDLSLFPTTLEDFSLERPSKKYQNRKEPHLSLNSTGKEPKLSDSSVKTRLPIRKIERKCGFFLCNRYETHSRFKVCLWCRTPYCSKECQINDWKRGNHKNYCRTFVQIKTS